MAGKYGKSTAGDLYRVSWRKRYLEKAIVSRSNLVQSLRIWWTIVAVSAMLALLVYPASSSSIAIAFVSGIAIVGLWAAITVRLDRGVDPGSNWLLGTNRVYTAGHLGSIFTASDEKPTLSFGDDTMHKGVLVVGHGGAGKTTLIAGIVGQAIRRGGGCIAIDGSIDSHLSTMLAEAARLAGRTDDFHVLRLRDKDTGTLLPFDPLDGLDDKEKLSFLIGLIDATDRYATNISSIESARDAIRVVLWSLIRRRDASGVPFDLGDIARSMDLASMLELASETEGIRYYAADSCIEFDRTIPDFLRSIRDFSEERGLHQSPKVAGFLEGVAELVRSRIGAISALGETDTNYRNTVSIPDVVLGRQILVVEAPGEVRRTGKSDETLERVIGPLQIVLERENAAGRGFEKGHPFLLVGDEIGVKPSLKLSRLAKAHPGAIDGVVATSRPDAPAMTGPVVYDEISGAGEGRSHREKFSTTWFQTTIMLGSFNFPMDVIEDYQVATFDEIDRINPLDVKRQQAGEFIAVIDGNVVYGSGYYANPYQARTGVTRARYLTAPTRETPPRTTARKESDR